MNDLRQADATRSFIAFKVERTHSRLVSQATRLLAKHSGLTLRQWWIIADMMAERPKTATELSQLADIDKGLLSRNLKALAEMDLVALTRDDVDHRQVFISLTDKGIDLHNDTLPMMQARNEHLVSDLTSDEIDVVLRVLDKVAHAAEETNFIVREA